MPELEIPAFVRQQIAESYGADEASLVERGFDEARTRPVTLRANTLKAQPDDIADALDAARIAYRRVPWYRDAFVLEDVREKAVWDLDIYREGRVYLQSLSSMMPPLVLEPRPGADILDMCAAPGGKTSQVVALSDGTAHMTACEMNGPRAEKLQYNLDKLGCRNVQVMRVDARRLDKFFSFDQILLDALCTGSGTICSGDERAGRRITEALLNKVTRSQRALLDRALDVLKPGGTLVYSTCSIFPAENEEQVAAALKRHRDCEVAPVELAGADGKADAPIMLPGRIEGTCTICPSRLYEGFFIARITKKDPKKRKR
ncbi:Fmu (Sun) domain-containing protein [Collinsella sp. An271]|uniref:RsmB/NOP family class I SAM-dependent RNA methyltransferase n=1 Tax=Collinsella sp. An271 TaxID=1965616 RepID=UPI000B3913AB|nr:RsmB/NOP family class I SAM-dependent RNA methyltransferase [Collinsella sp. An271]OUO62031.1 Fmu (Sun) domain-containing protein [Collinsella sp. An271]